MGNEDPFHPSAVGYGVAELMPCSETRRLKSNHRKILEHRIGSTEDIIQIVESL